MKPFLLLIASFCSYNLSCQNPQTIKVKKENENFYFFQKGISSDTISKNKGDLFYFVVNDKLKNNLIILIENGQFVKTGNDSIFKFNYIRGIAYECLFEKIPEKSLGQPLDKDHVNIKYEFKCLVNGVSAEERNRISFRFKLKNEAVPFLENRFYYRE